MTDRRQFDDARQTADAQLGMAVLVLTGCAWLGGLATGLLAREIVTTIARLAN